MRIEEIIKTDELVTEAKEKPVVYTIILIAAVVLAYFSVKVPSNGGVGFAITFVSIIVAAMGLKGVIWPKKYYVYKPTKEKLVRKEYYFDMNQIEAVKKCVAVDNPKHSMDMIESLPRDGATSLRVIVYATKSGSYLKSQIQKYIPYEYVPY